MALRATLMMGTLVMFMVLPAVPARGQLLEGPQRPTPRDVTFEQRLGSRVPLDAAFRDDAGREVRLADYFGQGPVLLVLAYYECPMLCTLVLNGTAQGLKDVPFRPGRDFQIVVISIDPGETPELATRKKLAYVAHYGRAETADGWHFLTGEQAQIDRVAQAIGYRYAYDPPTGQYAHPAGITFLTREGVVSRYLFNSVYDPIDMRLALAEASDGRIGNLIDRIAAVCFVYDPMAGRYGFAIRTALRIGATVTVLGMAALIGGLWWRGRKKEGRGPKAEGRGPTEIDASAASALGPRPSALDSPPRPSDSRPIPALLPPAALLGRSLWEFPLFPQRASTFAEEVDFVYMALVAMSVFFTVLICALLAFFAVKYRAGSPASRANPIMPSTRQELVWVGVPLVISLGLFYWSAELFFRMRRPPPDTLNIEVIGKQWMWKLQHPNGRREINELHVPVGQPVRLNMISQDVIHSFYVPAFRVKMDVLPSGYTSLWFEATRIGEYHLFCAEYCGTDHSRMIGRVVVMSPADYQAWLTAAGDFDQTADALAGPFVALGCNTCHVPDSEGRAPLLHGLFGREVLLADGSTVVADENYLRESILFPQRKIAVDSRGRPYPPVMPSFAGRVDAETLNRLIAYIKSLEAPPGAPAPPGDRRP